MSTINLKQCDDLCHQCIRNYAKKHRLQKGETFDVVCTGIPQQYIPDSVLASLGEDPQAALAMMDPVTWANVFLDWHCFDPDGAVWKRKTAEGTLGGIPAYNEHEHAEAVRQGKSVFHRPYQAAMLRCSSKRKIFRIGRQCLSGSTKLQLLDGRVVPIRDIQPGERLYSLNVNTHLLEQDCVMDSWSSGIKFLYRIKTQFGHEIFCTDNHPFWSVKENCDRRNNRPVESLEHAWNTINTGLEVGCKIATPLFDGAFGDKTMPDGLAELLGYFIADGSASKGQSAKFTNTSKQYLQEFELLALKFGTQTKRYQKGNGFDLIITNGRSKPNPLRDLLKNLGLTDITGPDKQIPSCVFEAPREQVRIFLQRFWAADGYISTFQRTNRETFRTEIGMLQESRELLEQTQLLLRRFGVHGCIKPEGKNWRYVVSNKIGVLNFLKNIGPIIGKEAACDTALVNAQDITDKYNHTEGDILWDHITEITPYQEEETFDISVKKNENFSACGIITHNSGKTEALCVMIAYSIFTHERFAVEVIAPYQNQIDIIFSRLSDMIDSNTTLANSVKRNVKAPSYQIKLENESYVIGFTAGTRSGQEGASARGQTANMLVFDEADYLDAKDIDSALAVIINHPDATVWMSSTPTGRREKFYESCQSKRYKEFHFPSSINPNWNDDLDQYYREELTEDGYKHEILADFGEQEEGVYQLKYVEAAQKDYLYENMKPNPTWIYMMGVDWNDFKIGTTIAVVGYSPQDNYFYLVDKQIVARAERTQLAACEKIASLNRYWNPAYIYVDQGYGATQIEVLQSKGQSALMQFGPNNPDARLRNIVKPFDFGKTVPIYDPFTKQPVPKPAKPFLVENSVRRFETLQFRYPKEDEHYTAQLLNYIVDRVSITGRPVYEGRNPKIGDHFIDAVNLALVAFTLEKSGFAKPVYSSAIAFGPRFGGGEDYIAPPKPRDKLADEHRPPPDRAGALLPDARILHSVNGDLPAARTSGNAVKIWSWPGFGRDEPRPQPRHKSPFESGSRRIKPRRAKF